MRLLRAAVALAALPEVASAAASLRSAEAPASAPAPAHRQTRSSLRPPSSPRTRSGSLLGLAADRAAPQVCRDDPVGWADVTGNACRHYQAKGFCTPAGAPGPGWDQNLYGRLDVWISSGKHAGQACCACGGGKRGESPPCGDLACPLGFSAKTGNLFCNGFSCNLEDDVDTCCEASPLVKLAVDETKALIAKLKQEVDQNITAAGNLDQQRATDNATTFATNLADSFKNESTAERTQAIDDAKTRMAALTKNSDKLQESARHQVLVSGYIAARAAVNSGAARVSQENLQKVAAEVADGFNNASKVWDLTNSTSHNAIAESTKAWDKYHADLNATWPVLVRSIQSINGAIQVAEHPSQEVRWTEQASRIAADMAHSAETQVKSLSSQVSIVQDRADSAVKLTLANRARIATLKEMVDSALAGEPSR